MSFRQSFSMVGRAVRWYPGHMDRSYRRMQQKLRGVDCVIEVHDARIPLSGRNPEIRRVLTVGGAKPHILVLNKMDMINSNQRKHIGYVLKSNGQMQNVIFTNCKNQQCSGVKEIIPLAQKLVSNTDRYNRTCMKDIYIMMMGIPNVGKSSLLNALRNKHLNKQGASQVGALPGITRSVLERIKISEDPPVYIIDTPGILEPRISDDETGMRLALAGCVPDHLVGEERIADYLLYYLNKTKNFKYVELLSLDGPTDNIMDVLINYASRRKMQRKVKKSDGAMVALPDISYAARQFIHMFRDGSLGTIVLDKNDMNKAFYH